MDNDWIKERVTNLFKPETIQEGCFSSFVKFKLFTYERRIETLFLALPFGHLLSTKNYDFTIFPVKCKVTIIKELEINFSISFFQFFCLLFSCRRVITWRLENWKSLLVIKHLSIAVWYFLDSEVVLMLTCSIGFSSFKIQIGMQCRWGVILAANVTVRKLKDALACTWALNR